MSGPGPSQALVDAPAPVRAAALAHGLGDRHFVYGIAASKVFGTCAFAVFGMVVAGFFWYGVTTTKDPGFLVVLALLFSAGAVYGVVAAVRALAHTGSTVNLFEGGLVHAGSHGASAYSWADTEVLREITRHMDGNTVKKTEYVYRLSSPGAAELRLESTAFDLEDLGPEIERRLTAARAPLDLDAVAAGRTVRYGPLAVDIATLSTPKAILTWSQVRAIDLHHGNVRIWTFEARKPQQVQISSVPNVFVFAALADALRIDAQRA